MKYIKWLIYIFIFAVLLHLTFLKYPYAIHTVGFSNPKEICIENKCFKRPDNYFFYMGHENYELMKFPFCGFQLECNKKFNLTNEKFGANTIALAFGNIIENKYLTVNAYRDSPHDINSTEMDTHNKNCTFISMNQDLKEENSFFYHIYSSDKSIYFDIITNDKEELSAILFQMCGDSTIHSSGQNL